MNNMEWAEAFHNVGMVFGIALCIMAYFWGVSKM